MGEIHGRSPARIAVVLAGLFITMVVLVVLVLLAQPRTDRIVDCAPGFHNVSGPASDCVPNQPSSPASSTQPLQ
ncbi:hypothetical protein OCL88_12155 [Paenarthrobacter sp. PAE-2]|jgi:hypothetical protein|nr:hypothetical protein [Paenarthrobacter sp. PAE-2]MCW3767230.1 hypothetical protein [Paenarthrobacter sp. PAE-2]